jgi:Flp pilus assembly protein TadD
MHAFARRLILLLGAALPLAACSHDGESSSGLVSSQAKSAEKAERTESAAAMLARAEELRAAGKPVQALGRLADAHHRFPDNVAIASTYGRLALLLGHDELAAPLLAEAVAADPKDWRALSAQGVLQSRHGQLPDGRTALAKANAISASEAVILNNLAVSHLLEGNAVVAASLLRQGLASPNLRPDYQRRLTRNLALALAVQGQFEEADRIASETMPRDVAGAGAPRLQRLLGVSEPGVAAETGWKAQLAASAPQEAALQ